MSDDLDFSLPDKKQKTSFASRAVSILLLILTALVVANLLITKSGDHRLPAENAASSLSMPKCEILWYIMLLIAGMLKRQMIIKHIETTTFLYNILLSFILYINKNNTATNCIQLARD